MHVLINFVVGETERQTKRYFPKFSTKILKIRDPRECLLLIYFDRNAKEWLSNLQKFNRLYDGGFWDVWKQSHYIKGSEGRTWKRNILDMRDWNYSVQNLREASTTCPNIL